MPEHELDPIFHPRGIALVGVPSGGEGPAAGFLNSLLEAKCHETHGVYPVNPKMEEVGGLKCYPTLMDTPDPVDHIISLVPARIIPELAEQAIQKGVRSVHFYTAGLAETGDPELAKLERQVVARLNAAGIRVIGPNCMGLYVPEEGLAFMGGFPTEPGNVMFISQSGANAGEVVHGLGRRGVRFSKVISFGNGSDLRAHHFLDYALSDPQTEIVTGYVEGVQDARIFFQNAKRLGAQKPLILLKGGLTSAGARAAHSHTGSLAGSVQIFDAMCRQAGAWRAETMDDLHDVAIAMTTELKNVRGRGVALTGGGGGVAVLSSDALASAGLEIPPTPEETKRAFREFIPLAGTSVNNPIDANARNIEDQLRMLRMLGQAEPFDLVITNPPMDRPVGMSGPQPEDEEDRPSSEQRAITSAERLATLQRETGVPYVVIMRNFSGRTADHFQREAYKRGVAVYPSIHRAARAIASVLDWRARREGLPEIF